MHHCQFCGSLLEYLEHGGCGGNGSIYGCKNCDRLFRQITGRIIATPGGETLQPISGGSYKSFKESGRLFPGPTISELRKKLELKNEKANH